MFDCEDDNDPCTQDICDSGHCGYVADTTLPECDGTAPMTAAEPAPDPFQAPEVETLAPGEIALVVHARDYQNQSPERHRALAHLVGVSPERVEALVAVGQPLVYETVSKNATAHARAQLLRDVTALPITAVVPPEPSTALLFVLLSSLGSLLLAFSSKNEPDAAVVFLGIAPFGIGATLWWYLARRATYRRIPSAIVARGAQDRVVEVTLEQERRDRGFQAVVLLAVLADHAEVGSDPWAAAVLRIAALHEAHGRLPVALRCAERVHLKRPQDEAARDAVARLRKTVGKLANGAPVRADVGGAGPWQSHGRAVLRIHGPNAWPKRCPICNADAPRSLPWGLRHNPGPDGVAAIILFLLMGPFGLMLAYLGSAVTAKTELWLCEAHHTRLRRARAAIWALPVLVAVLMVVAAVLASWWPVLLSGIAAFLVIPALGERNVIRGTSSSRGLMSLEGVHRDFVQALPEMPDELLE